MAGSSSVVVVFARCPVPGKTKTRLARSIGDEAAAEVYSAFVEDIGRRLAGASVPIRWAVAPPDEGFAARFGLDPDVCSIQEGADLGERMRHAVEAARRDGAERVVVVGSDAPHMPPERINEALEALREHDVVAGPAEDGGYYLIALRGRPDVFSGIAWSTDAVLAQTEAKCAEEGLRVARLASEFDVDEVADLARLQACLRRDAALGRGLPATAARIRHLDLRAEDAGQGHTEG